MNRRQFLLGSTAIAVCAAIPIHSMWQHTQIVGVVTASGYTNPYHVALARSIRRTKETMAARIFNEPSSIGGLSELFS